MATRKVFIDGEETKISVYLNDNNAFIIEIVRSGESFDIILTKEESIDFAMENYRLGRKLKWE